MAAFQRPRGGKTLHSPVSSPACSSSKPVGIGIFHQSLTGTIPTEIGNLTNLSNLDFGDNHLTGSVPSEIGNLTNLKSILIQENRLSGTIPEAIGNLPLLGKSVYLLRLMCVVPTRVAHSVSFCCHL